jgi:hypothetical protein
MRGDEKNKNKIKKKLQIPLLLQNKIISLHLMNENSVSLYSLVFLNVRSFEMRQEFKQKAFLRMRACLFRYIGNFLQPRKTDNVRFAFFTLETIMQVVINRI